MKSITLFFKSLTVSKTILLILSPAISTLVSMKSSIIGLLILILIDLITGIRKTHHINKVKFSWKTVKSYLLRQTWKKTYEYGIGIVAITILQTLIFGEINVAIFDKELNLAQLSVIIPSLIELWSVFENLEAVSGNNPLKKLESFLPEFIQKIFNKNEEGPDN